MRRSTGRSVRIGRGDEAFLAFIPDPLPPVPPLVLGAVLSRMRKLGIALELTGFERNRVFAYGPYVKLLEEGTDPLRVR
jgi:hypothetical protein